MTRIVGTEEFFPLSQAAKEIGCFESDILHAGVAGKIPLYVPCIDDIVDQEGNNTGRGFWVHCALPKFLLCDLIGKRELLVDKVMLLAGTYSPKTECRQTWADLLLTQLEHGGYLLRPATTEYSIRPNLLGVMAKDMELVKVAVSDKGTKVNEKDAAGAEMDTGQPTIAQPLRPLRTVGSGGGPDLSIKYKIETPNWNRWKRVDITRLWIAACLVANIEPPTEAGKELWTENHLTGLPQAFHDVWYAVNWDGELSRLETLPYSGRMLWKTHLAGFARWAIRKGFQVPSELREISDRLNACDSQGIDTLVIVATANETEKDGGGVIGPGKWWHEYEPLKLAERIKKRMRENCEFVLAGKDAGKISLKRICEEISSEITETERRRAIKSGQKAKPISYKTIETYLKKEAFDPNR